MMKDLEQPRAHEAMEAMDLLRVFAQLHGMSVDTAQLSHAFAQGVSQWGTAQALQALAALGFEAGLQSGTAVALQKAALPALAFSRDGGMLIVGQATPAMVVFQRAGARIPESMTPE
ncbi:MAG: hypothetical protein EOO54_19920, partial [Haliea sp.]